MAATAKIAIPVVIKILVLIPSCVVCALAAYSFLAGWTFVSSLFFWLLVMPLALFGAAKAFAVRSAVHQLISLLIFYGFVVLMTYHHFLTDAFLIMMLSLLYNISIMVLVVLSQRDEQRNAFRQT